MTVCIAVKCESGKQIVVAADRMLTFVAPLNLEFETEEEKVEKLSESCVALMSGNTAYAMEIIQNTRLKLSGNASPNIGDVAELVKQEYSNCRMKKFYETSVVAMLGSDFERHVAKGGFLPNYLQTQPMVFQQLVALSQQFNLGVDLIVAGIDATSSHIFVVTNPGTYISMDKLGFTAIGSGGIHATAFLSLAGQTGKKPFFETLYNVYVSKRVAESAPGVGQGTDIAVIESGKIWQCTKPILDELKVAFEAVNKKQAPQVTKIEEVYKNEYPSN
jgi:20S proteasome alpha/beta subunit